MTTYTKMMEEDPSWQDVMELIRELKRSADLQKQLTDKLEKAIYKHPQKDEQGKVCREENRYEADAYMPDYVLDERGFIIDVLKDRVRIPYKKKRRKETDGDEAGKE